MGVHNFRFGEHGTTGCTGRTLACSPFVLVGFGDAVMCDGALILFKYEDDLKIIKISKYQKCLIQAVPVVLVAIR